MKWITRRGCHVDRAGSAWLIRRFVDPDAAFVFVDDPDEHPFDATPFDMPGAELSHHDGDCTFETLLRRYALADQALVEIGRIIHEADLGDERLLEVSGPLFDGLYSFKQRAQMLGREPA